MKKHTIKILNFGQLPGCDRIEMEVVQVAQKKNQIDVYLETGKTRTFAVAIDWPGWARSGRDEASALETLYDYGPRYARVLESTGLEFCLPSEVADLNVIERVEGNATTDFGAPAVTLLRDSEPIGAAELARAVEIIQACWQAFDTAVAEAAGRSLRKGPRGGQRWLPRYFIRRLAWHELDHAWEIENRVG